MREPIQRIDAMNVHDHSARASALVEWCHSQEIPLPEAAMMLADLAAVLIVEATVKTGDLMTLSEGVTAFQGDILRTALRLYETLSRSDESSAE